MNLGNDNALWLLFAVPLVLAPAYVWCFWRKARTLRVLASNEMLAKINSTVSLRRQIFKACLLIAAFACIVVALTEPKWNPQPQQVRRKGRDRMEFLLANWKQFGSPHVTTETGTYTTKADVGDSPKNTSEEGYQDLKREVAGLVKLAEKSGAVVNIEVSWRQVIGTIDRAERLLREIPSPALKLTLDPANFFRPQDLPRMKPMLEEMFRRLGPQIVMAHAKDVRATGDKLEYPPAGLGMIDYLTFLSLLAQLDRPIDLVLEYLKLEDVSRTVGFLRGVMDKLP